MAFAGTTSPALTFLPYGVAGDHFQHLVYENQKPLLKSATACGGRWSKVHAGPGLGRHRLRRQRQPLAVPRPWPTLPLLH